MAFRAGDKFGEYEIVSLLGQGGMGEVYKARDSSLKRDVAIKVMRGVVAGDVERSVRFQREAEVLASLDHPNIGPIYGVADSGDARGLVLALIEGPTLADRLASGPIAVGEAIAIAKQIIAALEYAHERGVVHRDLKPANIKVNAEGVVKVLDFGLAKVIEQDSPARPLEDSPTLTQGQTKEGMILGTAAYMSPEQAVGRPVDRRSDIFAMGSVLYEMLAGRRAFDGATVADVLEAVISGEPDMSRVPQGAVKRVLERMLVKDRKQRMQAIGEARIALEQSEVVSPEVVPKPAGGKWKVIAAALAVLALGLPFLVYRWVGNSEVGAELLDLRLSDGNAPLQPLTGTLQLSPDGKSILFYSNRSLWVRAQETGKVRKLVENLSYAPNANLYPSWSPDSRWVLYLSSGRLMRIAVAGGPAVVVCEVDDFRGADWNQRDVLVMTNRGGVWTLPVAGGKPEKVLDLDRSRNEETSSHPQFLPDGRHFLFSVQKGDRTKSAIYVGDLEAKTRQLLLDVPSNAVYAKPGYLFYTKNRTLFAQAFDADALKLSGEAVPVADNLSFQPIGVFGDFSVSQSGKLAYVLSAQFANSQLTWFDRTGKAVGTVGGPAEMELFSLSLDDSKVVSTRLDKDRGLFDLWLHDLERRTDSRLTTKGNNRFPVLFPDGKSVAFDSGFENERHVYRMDLGGAEKRVILANSILLPSAVSNDERYLVAGTPRQTPETGNDIWLLPQFGDRKEVVYLKTKFSEASGKLSPDGRWMAYTSTESGEREVYVNSFPEPGEKHRISRAGGQWPAWSRDGKELYFYSLTEELMATPVKSGARFEYGEPKVLFPIQMKLLNTTMEVSRDGRFLIDVLQKDQDIPMKVLLNWPALFKK